MNATSFRRYSGESGGCVRHAGWGADTTHSSIQSAILAMISDVETFGQKGLNARKLSLNYSWSSLAMSSHEQYKIVLSTSK